MRTTLHVCLTCKAGLPLDEGAEAPGARLFRALEAAGAPEGVTLKGALCLSACDHGCNIALTKPGGWSYVYGGLNDTHVPDILTGAAAYHAAPEGLTPWRERPIIFRKQSLARIPPLES